MQVYIFKIRFLEASGDACKNPTELYIFLEAAVSAGRNW